MSVEHFTDSYPELHLQMTFNHELIHFFRSSSYHVCWPFCGFISWSTLPMTSYHALHSTHYWSEIHMFSSPINYIMIIISDVYQQLFPERSLCGAQWEQKLSTLSNGSSSWEPLVSFQSQIGSKQIICLCVSFILLNMSD